MHMIAQKHPAIYLSEQLQFPLSFLMNNLAFSVLITHPV